MRIIFVQMIVIFIQTFQSSETSLYNKGNVPYDIGIQIYLSVISLHKVFCGRLVLHCEF